MPNTQRTPQVYTGSLCFWLINLKREEKVIPIDNRSYSWQSGSTLPFVGYLLTTFSVWLILLLVSLATILPHLAGSEGASRASLCEEDAVARNESASGPRLDYSHIPPLPRNTDNGITRGLTP